MSDRFVMRWPVVDKSRPVAELVKEARADLAETWDELGVVPVSVPNFSMTHGRSPVLRAEVQVRFA